MKKSSRRGSSGSTCVWSFVAVTLLAPLGAQSGPKSRAPISPLRLHHVSNGFGNLLPHRVPIPDAQGLPTPRIVEIRTFDDLRHVRPTNPILPVVEWPVQAVLPNAVPGNHFVLARFDQALDIDALLTDRASAASQANLTGAIRVERVDPSSGARRSLRGRAFVGGRTYGSPDPDDPARLLLETWVESDGLGQLTAVDPRGLGFPGTEDSLEDMVELVDPSSFVFVPDADGDLSTHETFPAGVEIQVSLTKKVLSRSGQRLEAEGLASSSVGADVHPPEILARKGGRPVIQPGDGQQDVDPRTDILIRFTEPIQLLSIGGLDGTPPSLSAAVEIRFGSPPTSVSVPFTVRPRSVFDLTKLVLDPAYDFPGSGPVLSGCADFASVDVRVLSGRFLDLRGNVNTRARSSSFRTAPGTGLVNAPVTPDTIYVARAGGISVIDLNGYGASTGNPAFDPAHPILEGNSNYPNNPNVALQGAVLIPPLAPGTCPVDGGSAGVFTLTRDSNLGEVLVGGPTVSSVGEMALGHALDTVYNNGSLFGCAVGGGNLCASSGLKRAVLIMGGPNTLASASSSPTALPVKVVFGGGNLVSWAPHPNPPPLVFPCSRRCACRR